jgi:hypothetical protein
MSIELIISLLGELIVLVFAAGKIYSDFRKMDARIDHVEQELTKKLEAMEQEHKDLKKQLKELNDTLILVKHNTELLLLGRIKTGKINNES